MLTPFRADRSEPLLEMLRRRFADTPRAKILQVLRHGSVTVNGRVVTLHRHPVSAGDAVGFLGRNEARAKRFESGQDFRIVHEDESVIVVDKPAGLLTVPTDRERTRTLQALLTEVLRMRTGGRDRAWIVHRLDRETSGLVVFAKTERAKERLQANWKQTVKKYTAVTEGAPRETEGTIRGYLEEDASRRVWNRDARTPASKEAVTHFRVLRRRGRYAFLEIDLETGRKNQIRVHLQGAGCPVAGDRKYGAQTDPIGRLALHAAELSFPHPETGELLTFRSPLPAEFTDIRASDK